MQPLLPGAQAHLAFDQAAQDAGVLGEADGVGAHQAVLLELQAQVAEPLRVAGLHVLSAGEALPGAERSRR